jgi:hypothetical protein
MYEYDGELFKPVKLLHEIWDPGCRQRRRTPPDRRSHRELLRVDLLLITLRTRPRARMVAAGGGRPFFDRHQRDRRGRRRCRYVATSVSKSPWSPGRHNTVLSIRPIRSIMHQGLKLPQLVSEPFRRVHSFNESIMLYMSDAGQCSIVVTVKQRVRGNVAFIASKSELSALNMRLANVIIS